jgi:hypothetical protein
MMALEQREHMKSSTGSQNPLSFFISTPVWGKNHVRLFLSIGLPSLLAPGNLPSLARGATCKYLIYTRQEDVEILEASAAFRRLEKLLPVEIRPITEEITQPHRTMSDCHMHTMELADAANAAALFLPPDCVWSDGSLSRLMEIARSGKSVVHMSGVRLDRDAVMSDLLASATENGEVLQIAPRPLVDTALRHLHPIAFSHFWNEHEGDLMPANLMWTVPGEGLLLRCFHLHPLMVKSQLANAKFASTIDDDLVPCACPDPRGDYVVTDSDELLAFELSGRDRVVGTVCAKGSVEGVASWAEFGTNMRHRELIKEPIKLHYTALSAGKWAAKTAESQRVVDQILFINAASSGALLLNRERRRVLVGRLVAAALRGRTGDGRAPLWATSVNALTTFLSSFNQRVYRRLFVRAGKPSILHPSWLMHRAGSEAVARCITAGERKIALVGASESFLAEFKEKQPHLSVVALDRNASGLVSESELSGFDMAVAVDADRREDPPPMLVKLSRAGLKCCWLQVGRVPDAEGNGWRVDRIGGWGTSLIHWVLGTQTLLSNAKASARGGPRLLRATARLLFSGPVYLSMAGAGLLLNSFGLLLDQLPMPARGRDPVGRNGLAADKLQGERR